MAETLLEKVTKERMHKQGCYEYEHKCETEDEPNVLGELKVKESKMK